MYQIDVSTTGGSSGYSVSLSSDGTIVAISAPYTNSYAGATRIYKWNNTTWILLGSQINGLAANEQSGYSVSLSSDGTTVAIGAPYANSSAGATRIYKWNNSSWNMLGSQIDGSTAAEQSGRSVSLSSDGTTVAIGVPYANNYKGLTRIYKWNSQNSSWSMIGSEITGSTDNDRSGHSISLSSDGTTVAIGTPYGNYNNGLTRIYKLNGQTWDMTKQIDGTGRSGYSVSLSSDGTTVAIGAPYARFLSIGSTLIYKWNGQDWVMTKQIDGITSIYEYSGWSVSLSSDGTTVAIGAPNANDNMGAARIYKYQ
jgi:hypothetical protein